MSEPLKVQCPHCGSDAARDEVDVGVGMIYGPWGCFCGWCEDGYYDSTNGPSAAQREHPDFILDTLGGMRRRSPISDYLWWNQRTPGGNDA